MAFLRIITLIVVAFFVNHQIYCTIEEPTKGKIFKPDTQENFEMMLSRYDLVLVDFYADWCGPCKHMHRVIESLAQDRELDQVLFIEINTDTHHTLSSVYHIASLPTIIIFLDGKPLTTLYGYKDKKSLKKVLLEALRELNQFI